MALRYLLATLLLTSLLCPIRPAADFSSAIDAYKMHNYVAAFEQLLPLAQTGDAKAQTMIGMMYKYGEGVAVDPDAAFQWYLAAAQQGDAPAQLSVAEMYLRGQGTAVNSQKALLWAGQAADQKLSRAIMLYERLQEEAAHSLPIPAPGAEPTRKWNLKLPPAYKDSTPEAEDPGNYRVQLGAMKSLASATRLWNLIEPANRDLFHDLTPFYRRSVSRKEIVRLQAGPFKSLADAQHLCRLLEQRGLDSCLPIRSIETSSTDASQ